MLRSCSVLLAAYLHALNNLVFQIIVGLGFAPFDYAFSFGIGICGIATLAIIALLVLRDPIWRDEDSNLTQPAPVGMALSENPGAVEKAADQASLGTA